MKTKKSAMVCWAIGLLIFQMSSTAISYLAYYDFVYFISLLSECIPTIGGIILIFYDHKYNSPIVGNFTLLRIWSIVLIWVQPVISFLSWTSAGLIGSVIATWIGSCVFIIISTILLVKDGKEFVKKRAQADSPTESQQDNGTKYAKIDSEKEINEQQNPNEQHIISSDTASVQASEQTEQENDSDDWFTEDKIPTPVAIGISCIAGVAFLMGIILPAVL